MTQYQIVPNYEKIDGDRIDIVGYAVVKDLKSVEGHMYGTIVATFKGDTDEHAYGKAEGFIQGIGHTVENFTMAAAEDDIIFGEVGAAKRGR